MITRRGFLQFLGLAPVAAVVPNKFVGLEAKVVNQLIDSAILASGTTTGSFTKALWPGINAWYGRVYKDGDLWTPTSDPLLMRKSKS